MENNSYQKKLNAFYRFPGQREGEEIKMILRKHKITLISFFLYMMFLAFLPLVFYLLIAPDVLPSLMTKPYSDIFVLSASIYYGFLWIILFMGWSDYYLDIWIITNERLLDVEQKGLFHRIVSELDLKRVQDITSNVSGAIPTFFEFGDIDIQTAAEMNKFKMKSIPHPVTIRREITELCRIAQEKNRWVFKEEE